MMRNTRILWAGLFLVVGFGLTASTASAQVVYPPAAYGVYAPRYAAYPYGPVVYNPRRAYRQAVRYGYVPVVPVAPLVTRAPTDFFGRPMYGPPYYAYPRPQIVQGMIGYDARPVPAVPQAQPTLPPVPTPAPVEAVPPPAPVPYAEPVPAPSAESIAIPSAP